MNKNLNSYIDDLLFNIQLPNDEELKRETTSQKLSIAGKGKKMPKDAIEKIRKANKGRTITKEHRNKISNTLKGNLITNETKIKMSKSRIGLKHSNKTIEKLKKSAQKRCVPISKYTLDNIWIEDFIGMKEAAVSMNMQNGRAIQLVCNYYKNKLSKGSKQCKGFIWKYKNID
jgi:hypothetical protein